MQEKASKSNCYKVYKIMRKSEILQEDFLGITESFNGIDSFANSKFLVTGATGLIGSLIVKFLIFLTPKRLKTFMAG